MSETMMKLYNAYEFDKETGAETGTVEVYLADSPREAVLNLLTTRLLADGHAKLGPTGRVVYSRGSAWALVPVPMSA